MSDPSGPGCAAFCRSEHIAAWAIRGGQWQLERPWEAEIEERTATGPLELVRERGGVVSRRDFAGLDQLREWATRGGFWGEDAVD